MFELLPYVRAMCGCYIQPFIEGYSSRSTMKNTFLCEVDSDDVASSVSLVRSGYE
jgi:hypothetical protein